MCDKSSSFRVVAKQKKGRYCYQPFITLWPIIRSNIKYPACETTPFAPESHSWNLVIKLITYQNITRKLISKLWSMTRINRELLTSQRGDRKTPKALYQALDQVHFKRFWYEKRKLPSQTWQGSSSIFKNQAGCSFVWQLLADDMILSGVDRSPVSYYGKENTSQRVLPFNPITHGHCPQGKSVSSLLGADVLPVLSTALTTNTFSHSGRA